ncbi:MAG TPA: enoyl-CoA hydratase/isomerase family protein [Polyangia bacterium]|nr:enoyl-CoA hydratase/isomerase family protein [Polyangia bacterium]
MIDIIDHGAVWELRLARPPVNALDPALMRALRDGLADAHARGAEALVLSGSPGRFSGGLDVPALLKLDRAGIADAWTTFFALLRDLAAAPVPIAAALTGHSPAGGTVLALFADHRVLAEGPFLVGLNEVRVGLPVPTLLLRALAFLVGERHAARLAVGGLLVGPEEALRVGLVDALAPPDEVVPRAIAWARDLLERPRAAMIETRARVRRPLVDAFDALDAPAIDAIADQWFSAEAQATLQGLAARLSKR